jgi:hypothetical protein
MEKRAIDNVGKFSLDKLISMTNSAGFYAEQSTHGKSADVTVFLQT